MIRVYGGQPVEMGNAGAFQAQSPLYTTPLAPVWGGGPLVPGDVPGREYFRGPEPTQKYKMGSSEMPLGNVGGLLAQDAPFYGDTIDMGPAPGTYSNMPVIPDEAEEQFQREMLLEQFRNRAFPPVQTPVGFGGKYVS